MDSPHQTLKSLAGAIVTGGSSGIGACFLDTLSNMVPELPLCNLSRSKPVDFGPSPGRCHIATDLADPGSRLAGIDKVRHWVDALAPGPLLLINNSGFGNYGSFPQPSVERHTAMIAVNVTAPVELTGHLLPVLETRGGAVLNIASTAAFQPTPFLATYGATKAFLLHWSLSIAEEYRRRGVQVLCVCPGPTSTAFFSAAGFKEAPLGAGGQRPEQVVRASLRALAAGRHLVTSGWQNKLLAASASKLPKTVVARLAYHLLRKLRLERFQ